MAQKNQGIKIDFAKAFSSAVGTKNGVTALELKKIQKRGLTALEAFEKKEKKGGIGFASLPFRDADIRAMMRKLKPYKGRFTHLVVLGIGGSALGGITLQSALSDFQKNRVNPSTRHPDVRFLDNVDPEEIHTLAEILPLDKTLFFVITKSGGTSETLSAFLYFWDKVSRRVGSSKARKQFVFFTDPEKGFLRGLGREYGFDCLSIPGDVGGRFSVLTSVGLGPAYMMGISVSALLKGAAKGIEKSRKKNPSKNPAIMLASLLHCMAVQKKKPMVVMLPYSERLYDFSDWFRQLWAESLGKYNRQGRCVGQTPIKALGTTDQHSQIQLYVEGPKDKVVILMEVKNYRPDVKIPRFSLKKGDDTISFLEGKSFGKLFHAEGLATRQALVDAGCPTISIELDRVGPEEIGELFSIFEMATAISGELYGIDAFDQPGVEAGKIYTGALMGKKGLGKIRKKLEKTLQKSRKYVI